MAITERDLEDPDPLRLSREIEAVAGRVRRFRRRVREGEGFDDDPFFPGRLVAGKNAFVAIRALPDGDPLRRPLERWIYRLAEARINRAAVLHVARERCVVERAVSAPEHAKMTLAAILDRVLGEPARRAQWFASYVRAGEPLGDSMAVLWERRAEVASRMGVGDADAIESPGIDVLATAEEWLLRTNDVFFDICESSDRLWDVALGTHANDGVPRRLTPRVIADQFRETDLLRGLDLDPGTLPQAFSPASFLRALARVGAAWTDAAAALDQPFVIAHDPYGLRRRTFGALLGMLPAHKPFAMRALGVDASRLPEHARALVGALLTESRGAALRVVLRRAALGGRRAFLETFEARVAEVFRLGISPHAAGTLWRPRVDSCQRLAGLLLAAAEAQRLREAHDEDWYRNPRATEELRDEARRPPDPTTTSDALARGAKALYGIVVDTFR